MSLLSPLGSPRWNRQPRSIETRDRPAGGEETLDESSLFTRALAVGGWHSNATENSCASASSMWRATCCPATEPSESLWPLPHEAAREMKFPRIASALASSNPGRDFPAASRSATLTNPTTLVMTLSFRRTSPPAAQRGTCRGTVVTDGIAVPSSPRPW